MDKPTLILQKNADRTTNKMIIPQYVIKKFGNQFYMEIYEDKIILIPIQERNR